MPAKYLQSTTSVLGYNLTFMPLSVCYHTKMQIWIQSDLPGNKHEAKERTLYITKHLLSPGSSFWVAIGRQYEFRHRDKVSLKCRKTRPKLLLKRKEKSCWIIKKIKFTPKQLDFHVLTPLSPVINMPYTDMSIIVIFYLDHCWLPSLPSTLCHHLFFLKKTSKF